MISQSLQKLRDQFAKQPNTSHSSELYPYGRITAKEAQENHLVRDEAAVCLLISPANEKLHLLFIRRNAMGIHGGQIAFPGGKRESHESFQTTAIRELEEETGIHISEKNLIGKLHDIFIAPSKFIVQPFVAISEEMPLVKPNTNEIDSAFWIELKNLLEVKTQPCIVQPSGGGPEITVNAFVLNNLVIWGATAIILDDFRMRVKEILC